MRLFIVLCMQIRREILCCLLISSIPDRKMVSLIQWCLIFVVVPFVLCDRSAFAVVTDRIMFTLTRALHFFSSHVDQVNLDAGIGTRMAADQLRAYTRCKHCQSVKKLADLSERVTQQIAESVRDRQPEYYAQLSFLLTPGTFSHIIPFQFHRNKNHEMTLQRKCSPSPFIEKYSDQCLYALAFKKCGNTKSCVQFMNDSSACRYSLTHQLLYSIIAERYGCYRHQLSPSDEQQMVARMFGESQSIASTKFLESDRDLFMEQIAIGGLLGWSDFFDDAHWFMKIISWQHPIEGCYGNDTIINHRKKREEMAMSHYCLSHRTSVAIAALSQILRYLLSRDI